MTKSNVLEEYMVELALKGNKIGDLPELTDPFWSKVVESLKTTKITDLPPELRVRTEELMLRETEFDAKEWAKTLDRWEARQVKGQLKSEFDSASIQKLSKKLSDLTRSRG